jgi:hypothetical protein
MAAPSSAPEPHEVSGMTCRFAGPTSGTVARAYSSLDSPRDRLATVCRLRNNVVDVLREPLKTTEELHEPGRLMPAAAQIKFSCCWQAVGSADSATGRYHKTLPGHHDRVLTALAHVCAGVGSCSEFFVGTTILASGRLPSTDWSSRCSGDARTQRSGDAAVACIWLTVPHTHDSGLDFR